MSKELANIPDGGNQVAEVQTDMQARIDIMLANRSHVIEKINPLLMDGVDVYTLPNAKTDDKGRIKKSLGKPGAEKLAAIFNLAVSFELDKETMEVIGATFEGRRYVAYKAVVTSNGIFKGEGRGASFVEATRNAYKNIYQKDYLALSDEEKKECQGPYKGTPKNGGNSYTYWRIATDPVFDPLALNKAIKMAQKSAFVDAVIRVTGMSDLFTQDVEDMSHDQFEPPKAETKPETPKPEPQPTQEVKEAKVVGIEVLCTVADCGGVIKEKKGPRGTFYGCSNYHAKGCKATMTPFDYDAALYSKTMSPSDVSDGDMSQGIPF